MAEPVRAARPTVVLAGGRGALGRALADAFAAAGHTVVVLTRSPRADAPHLELGWDGRSIAGDWGHLVPGSILVNLAGELVDRRPTRRAVDGLTASRVEPTRALVEASRRHGPPAVWLQMSTLAIYGDAGEARLTEGSPPADGPPQMAGVATAWEHALSGAAAERLVVMRTGIVLDEGTPALDRLTTLTRRFLGGRVGPGTQWVSWMHVDDFVRAVLHLATVSTLSGVVHVTGPTPVRNRDLMRALRRVLRRPWAPPTPTPLVHVGAWLVFRSDPALALTGRHATPDRLLADGFHLEHADLDEALADLLG